MILPAGVVFPGLRDSKRLSLEIRVELDGHIRRQALALAIHEMGPRQIEQRGILAASLRAMARAIRELSVVPEMVLVDGNQPLPLTYPQQPVIKGDDRCPSIAAASVVAKVYRDRLMEALHQRYPQYNFARHKGYATAEHLEALRCWGPCALHRRTFRGVKEWLGGGSYVASQIASPIWLRLFPGRGLLCHGMCSGAAGFVWGDRSREHAA